MKSIVIPCFPKSILTKFVFSVRSFIVSIICNHPTDAMKRCVKNAYEKIAILHKCADGYAATPLTFYSSECVFFSFWVFFHKPSRFTGLQGKGNSSVLLPPTSRTRTGNLWFPSASVSFHSYVVETVQN